MSSMLEKAKKIQSRRSKFYHNPETTELAVAWMKGEVTGFQLTEAIGLKGNSRNSLYCYICTAIKFGLGNGLIEIIRKEE